MAEIPKAVRGRNPGNKPSPASLRSAPSPALRERGDQPEEPAPDLIRGLVGEGFAGGGPRVFPAPSDGAVWREAMRGVAPLPGCAPPAHIPAAAPRPAPSPRPAAPPASDSAGIDRATALRLKRGLYPIEAQLDLHGMTQAAAHRALVGFVAASREAGRRCVLIITGRGLATGEPGILRRAVPRWLDEPGLRPHVLAIASAQPRHGGPGALYLLLRRRR